jgi:hypothetical protein
MRCPSCGNRCVCSGKDESIVYTCSEKSCSFISAQFSRAGDSIQYFKMFYIDYIFKFGVDSISTPCYLYGDTDFLIKIDNIIIKNDYDMENIFGEFTNYSRRYLENIKTLG